MGTERAARPAAISPARAAGTAPGPGATKARPGDERPQALLAAGHRFELVRLGRTPPAVQCKLEVGGAGDTYEREADRVADTLVGAGRPPLAPAGPTGHGPPDGGQARATVAAAQGRGRPLDGATRSYFEPRLGRDLGGVRIHTGAEPGRAARGLNAHAFTHDQDVFLPPGAYQPGTRQGRWLLAHELAHTVQQRPGVIARQVATAEPAAPPEAWTDAAVQQLAGALRRDPTDRSGQVRHHLERLGPGERQQVAARLDRELGPEQRETLTAVLDSSARTDRRPEEPPAARPERRRPEEPEELEEPGTPTAPGLAAVAAEVTPRTSVEPPPSAAPPGAPARGDEATVERRTRVAERTEDQRLGDNAGRLADAAADGGTTAATVQADAGARASGEEGQTAAEEVAGTTTPEGGFPRLADLLAPIETPPVVGGALAVPPDGIAAPFGAAAAEPSAVDEGPVEGEAELGPEFEPELARELAPVVAPPEALAVPVAEPAMGPVTAEGEEVPGLAIAGAIGTLQAAADPVERAILAAEASAVGQLRGRGERAVARVRSQVATAGSGLTNAITALRERAGHALTAAGEQLDAQLEVRRAELRIRAADGKIDFTDAFAAHRNRILAAVSERVTAARELSTRYATMAKDRSREQALRARRLGWRQAESYPHTHRGVRQANAVNAVAERAAAEIEERRTETIQGVEEVFEGIPDELQTRGWELLEHVDDPLPELTGQVDTELARAEERLDLEAGTARRRLEALGTETTARIDALEQGLQQRLAAFVPKAEAEAAAAVSAGVRQLRRARRTGVQRVRQLQAEGVEILQAAESPDEDSSNQFASEVAEVIRGAGEETVSTLEGTGGDMAAELDRLPPAATASLAQIRTQVETLLADVEAKAMTGAADLPTQADENFGLVVKDFGDGLTAARTLVQAKLDEALTAARTDLQRIVDDAEREAAEGVDEGFAKNEEGIAELPSRMREAAEDAAWDYDHPFLATVRDIATIVAAVIVAILAVIALVIVVILAIKGAIAVLVALGCTVLIAKIIVIGGLLVFTAAGAYQTYQSFRAKGQTAGGAVLSTALSLTGIADIHRAFTDESLTPWERGTAFGGGLATLASFVILRGRRAQALDGAISARLPRVITNPSRFAAWRALGRGLGVGRPATTAPGGIGGTIAEVFAGPAARPPAPPVPAPVPAAAPAPAQIPAGPPAPARVPAARPVPAARVPAAAPALRLPAARPTPARVPAAPPPPARLPAAATRPGAPPTTAGPRRPGVAGPPEPVRPPGRPLELVRSRPPAAPPSTARPAAPPAPARPRLQGLEGGRTTGPPSPGPRPQLRVVQGAGRPGARPQRGRPPLEREAAALERPVQVRQAAGAEGAQLVPLPGTPRPRLQVVGGTAPRIGGQAPPGPVAATRGGGRGGGTPPPGAGRPATVGTAAPRPAGAGARGRPGGGGAAPPGGRPPGRPPGGRPPSRLPPRGRRGRSDPDRPRGRRSPLERQYQDRVGRRTRYPDLVWRQIQQLETRFPGLQQFRLRPLRRPRTVADWAFYERQLTTQGRYTYGVLGPRGRRVQVQLDGITSDGWVQEIKTSLGRPAQRRGPSIEELPVDEFFRRGQAPRARRSIDRFGDPQYAKDRGQLQRQLDFADDAGLKGVRVECNDWNLFKYWRQLVADEFPGRVDVRFID